MGSIGGAIGVALAAGLFHTTIGAHPAVFAFTEIAGAMPEQSGAPFTLGEYATLAQLVALGCLLFAGVTAYIIGKVPGSMAFISAYFSGLLLPTSPDAGTMLLLLSFLLGAIASAVYGGRRGGAGPRLTGY
jgi:hypothetical protein